MDRSVGRFLLEPFIICVAGSLIIVSRRRAIIFVAVFVRLFVATAPRFSVRPHTP